MMLRIRLNPPAWQGSGRRHTNCPFDHVQFAPIKKGPTMKRSLLALCCVLGLASTAAAQIIVDPVVRTTYYAPAPTVSYYAPSVRTPVTTYYAPRTTYYSGPVTAYYSPATTTYYAPSSSAVTTYYAPATTAYSYPTTTYHAPTTSYYSPYTSYYAPASVYYGGTTVYRPSYIAGQPVRNVLRAVVW
jgi:hypothetical protein